ncbi:MAG: tRNA(adenine34) deaminase [Bacteriovoracaceae bacterium]|jgi:tRNA(adenine34) deaminase
MKKFNDIEWNMETALLEAELAYKSNEVPVGAVVVDKSGTILSKAHNEKESVFDPCGHAEILALKRAASAAKNWRLQEATLFVTLEPCPMCLSAALHARVGSIVFGAYDLKGGALSLGYNLYKDQRLNHNCSIVGGVLHYKCSNILSNFFREKRKFHS